jgi:predicted DNA-binding transcriptional regulator YafY
MPERGLDRGQAVELTYDTGGQGDWTQRIVRPLAIEQRYGDWYMRAYCTLGQAERTFRLDRIGAVETLKC